MSFDEIVSLRLERGSSPTRGFTLGPQVPRAIFRVGSALECNWRVEGPGVAPHHLMLLWKSGVLTLVNVGAGDLYCDGEAFSLTRVVDTGRIAFASALIVVARSRTRNAGGKTATGTLHTSK